MMPVQVVANGFGERDICVLQQIESCLGIEYLALGKHCRSYKAFPALTLRSGNMSSGFGFLP
jgi:hypothetical protein